MNNLKELAECYIETKGTEIQFNPNKVYKFHKSIYAYADYLNGTKSFDDMAEVVTEDMRFNLPFLNKEELTEFFGSELAEVVLDDEDVHVLAVR